MQHSRSEIDMKPLHDRSADTDKLYSIMGGISIKAERKEVWLPGVLQSECEAVGGQVLVIISRTGLCWVLSVRSEEVRRCQDYCHINSDFSVV